MVRAALRVTRRWLAVIVLVGACGSDRRAPERKVIAAPTIAATWTMPLPDDGRFVAIDADGTRRVGMRAELMTTGGRVVPAGAPLWPDEAEFDEPPPPEETEETEHDEPAPVERPRYAQDGIDELLHRLQGDASRGSFGFGRSGGVPIHQQTDAAVPDPTHHGVSGLLDREEASWTVVIAAPTAPAATLITTLEHDGGCIGVDAGADLACIPLALSGAKGADARNEDLVVLDLAADSVTVRTSHGAPLGTFAADDRAGIVKAHAAAMASAHAWWSAAIVTVDATVEVQRLVDVVALLLDHGVEAFGLRDWPVLPPRAVVVDHVVEGVDLEPGDDRFVRRQLLDMLGRFEACPRTADAVVTLAFGIDLAGKLTDVMVAPPGPLATCVAAALQRRPILENRRLPVVVTRATLHFKARP